MEYLGGVLTLQAIADGLSQQGVDARVRDIGGADGLFIDNQPVPTKVAEAARRAADLTAATSFLVQSVAGQRNSHNSVDAYLTGTGTRSSRQGSAASSVSSPAAPNPVDEYYSSAPRQRGHTPPQR